VAGPSKGASLRSLALTHTSWADWRSRHPRSEVLSTDTGHERDYTRDPYDGYEQSARLMFEVQRLDSRIFMKEWVLGLSLDGRHKAYPFDRLSRRVDSQGRLQDRQFRDMLTQGTALHKRWCMQVDSVAKYLNKLKEAHVPVLWRPYHEMNGDWFWWGGRTGPYSTAELYRQLFERLVYHHKLTNLIWVWSVDRPNKPEMEFHRFYPGSKYLDVLSLDVYGSDFNKEYYDSLLALSEGKPVVLGEVGNPPSPGILKNQPKWGFYVTWAGMVRNTMRKQYRDILRDLRYLSLEDSVYRAITASYRTACGLDPLFFPLNEPADFSGE